MFVKLTNTRMDKAIGIAHWERIYLEESFIQLSHLIC